MTTPAPRCDFDWRPHWDAFTARMAARATATGGVLHAAERAVLEAVAARLAMGSVQYGDRTFFRSLAEILREQRDELLDVVSYACMATTRDPAVADAEADVALAALALVAALGRFELGDGDGE